MSTQPMTDAVTTADELASVASRLVRRLRAEGGSSALTPSQSRVIRRLMEGSATTAELARAEAMRPQSMSANIRVLEALGYLGRRQAQGDGRAVELFLTEVGERAIAQSRAAKSDWLAQALRDRFDDTERQRLADAATLLERLLDA